MSIYIVFDGPPSHEAGRFVEVEDENGHGLGPSSTGAWWKHRADGYWTLGPFARVEVCTCGHELSAHTRRRDGLHDACSLCACTGVVREVPDHAKPASSDAGMDLEGVFEGARLGQAGEGS